MEAMEVSTTDHMDALEDVLSEHSVILGCVDVKEAMKLDMGHVSTTETHSKSLKGIITFTNWFYSFFT